MNTDKKALVTLAIGEKYERMFDRYCRDDWKHYCEKYSYDLIVLTKALDDSERARDRSPAWQKLLILSQEWSDAYEQILWLDTDIMINNHIAPDIVGCVPAHKVGAVEAYSIPSREFHTTSLERQYSKWHQEGVNFIDNVTPGLYYENRGIPGRHLDQVVQTGVFVASPKQHKELFEHIYYTYEDKHKSAEWNYEMPAMSYELVKNDMVHWIAPQFNLCVSNMISAFYPFLFHSQTPTPGLYVRGINKIKRMLKLHLKDTKSKMQKESLVNIFSLGYFIHFAGCSGMMEDLYLQLQETLVS